MMMINMIKEEKGNRGSNKKNPCEAEKLSLAARQVSPLVLNLRTHFHNHLYRYDYHNHNHTVASRPPTATRC